MALADVREIPIPGICLSCASFLWNSFGKKMWPVGQTFRLCRNITGVLVLQKGPQTPSFTLQRSPSKHQGLLAFSTDTSLFLTKWTAILLYLCRGGFKMRTDGHTPTSSLCVRHTQWGWWVHPCCLQWRNHSGAQTLHMCKMTLRHRKSRAFLTHSVNYNSSNRVKWSSHRELFS